MLLWLEGIKGKSSWLVPHVWITWCVQGCRSTVANVTRWLARLAIWECMLPIPVGLIDSLGDWWRAHVGLSSAILYLPISMVLLSVVSMATVQQG